jgi:nucleosome binding factor SPN SPT16 subunit
MGEVQSYNSPKEAAPRDLKPGLLYVDHKHDTVLIPYNNQGAFVPFHVSMIKSVVPTTEGQWTYLRINFNYPSGTQLQYPAEATSDPNALFIRELTLKNQSTKVGGENHLIVAAKEIKELMKKVKDAETEAAHGRQEAAAQEAASRNEPLQIIKGKREVLENLVIRPNITGKKTLGNLEIHQNGVRFAAARGQTVDISFSNVKHAFFQSCAEDELIVIIHFHLHAPIIINGKKVNDVQFFKESGVAADDLDNKAARKRMTDMDELEQEERERQARIKLNNRFANFVRLIEQQSESQQSRRWGSSIEFDIPFEDLGFYGCPHKSVVKLRPTKNCLIAISEFPFFVIDVADIETVHFERVHFGIKNFDMAIVFKDFTTFKRINSIPMEQIETIKEYLDEIGIIYSEGHAAMNWNNLLTQIRSDFESFLEAKGWRFLQDEDSENGEGEGAEDEIEDEDDSFELDEEEEGEEDSESDYSDDDDNDDDYSSSDLESEELSEEGLSWDEMDRRAEEEDRRNATRRSAKEPPPQQAQKRKPAGGRR